MPLSLSEIAWKSEVAQVLRRITKEYVPVETVMLEEWPGPWRLGANHAISPHLRREIRDFYGLVLPCTFVSWRAVELELENALCFRAAPARALSIQHEPHKKIAALAATSDKAVLPCQVSGRMGIPKLDRRTSN